MKKVPPPSQGVNYSVFGGGEGHLEKQSVQVKSVRGTRKLQKGEHKAIN